MTLNERNWCFAVVKQILIACNGVPDGSAFTHCLHTTQAKAKAICGMCHGFAFVTYEPIQDGVQTGDAQGFRLTIAPKG